ncbi:MAG TPA: PQQ-binding-like beta-propeller repeat protein, partial [Vicinamibacteria bacterium]|nr:PQQ-binding-like beta-propeller repeat protein [Vicinamibacteria bacterium]
SPLAYEQNVIVTLGGPGQALVAFDQATGRVAWKGGSLDVSPSSPIVVSVDGQDQLILFHADGIAGADPRSGQVYWTHPHATDYGLNISTPLWGPGNVLFLSSAYSGGSKGLKLSQSGGKTTVTQLWDSRRMRVHFGTAVRLGDRVYGSSGDFGPAVMTAIDVHTGNVAWQERGFARASVVAAGGKLVLVDEDGTLALATPGPAGLVVEGRQEVLEAKAWTAPTVVGTRVYLRDRESIKALELS